VLPLLLLLLLAFPFLLLQVLWLKLTGRLPRRWPFAFAIGVAMVRFLISRVTRPLLAGEKLVLPVPPLRGPLARATTRQAVKLAGRDAEWLSPLGSSTRRCILYLHGGAFVTGSIGTHRRLMANLAQAADARVVGLDYRLAPEHRFPAGLDDCVAAWQALLDAGEDPRHLAIAGDSAGGGLAASTLLALKQRGLPLPAAAWLLSPAVDLGPDEFKPHDDAKWDYLAPLLEHLEGLVAAYLGPGADRQAHLASPLRGDLSGLPPLLLHVGEFEVLLAQVRDFAAKARAAGVPVTLVEGPQMVHVYPAFAGYLPEANEAFVQAGAFFKRHL
jgi:acetyl esterase/lipase